MSSGAAELVRDTETSRGFAPVVVLHHSILEAMRAVRGDSYEFHLKDFFTFADGHGGVCFETLREYFKALNGKTWANSTKLLVRQAVKSRLRSALQDSMDFNAAAQFREALSRLDREVPAPKVLAAPVGSDRVIRRDEYDRLISAASYRDKLLLEFLWTTGCRVSELTGALVARCEADGKTVHIPVVGKGNKERVLRIRVTLYNAIRAEFRGTGYLFETAGGRPFSRVYVSTRVHRLAIEVLGRRLGAHALRHSFATRQIRRTGKIQAVSTYLGHSSTAITMNYYVHEQLEDDELFDPEDGE